MLPEVDRIETTLPQPFFRSSLVPLTTREGSSYLGNALLSSVSSVSALQAAGQPSFMCVEVQKVFPDQRQTVASFGAQRSFLKNERICANRSTSLPATPAPTQGTSSSSLPTSLLLRSYQQLGANTFTSCQPRQRRRAPLSPAPAPPSFPARLLWIPSHHSPTGTPDAHWLRARNAV